MAYDPAPAPSLRDRGAASDGVDYAFTHLGSERIAESRPAEIACRARLDLEGPIPEIRHFLELGPEMLVAIVGPAAVDSGTLDNGQAVARIQGVQSSEVATFGGREHCAHRGGHAYRVAAKDGVGVEHAMRRLRWHLLRAQGNGGTGDDDERRDHERRDSAKTGVRQMIENQHRASQEKVDTYS